MHLPPLRYPLRDVWEGPTTNVTVFYDSSPPTNDTRLLGLWELGNNLVAAAEQAAIVHAGHDVEEGDGCVVDRAA